jgi:hypothetical protein
MKLLLFPHYTVDNNSIRIYCFIEKRKTTQKQQFLIMLDKGGLIQGASKDALEFFGLEQ